MEKLNIAKSKMIYDIVDGSEGFYTGHAATESDRSIMNVVFKLPTPEQDADFVAKAAEAGLTTLKGHRSVGGIRASLYNAMPVEGVEALASFMKDFAAKA
jgi:phosphoserine aminotransferase